MSHGGDSLLDTGNVLNRDGDSFKAVSPALKLLSVLLAPELFCELISESLRPSSNRAQAHQEYRPSKLRLADGILLLVLLQLFSLGVLQPDIQLSHALENL